MPDREKVIKQIEKCINDTSCIGCPYKKSLVCRRYMLADALALLKEQEAVEPNVSSAEQRCGNCNKVIEMDGWQSCPWCGKRIDWKGWWKKNGTRNQDS